MKFLLRPMYRLTKRILKKQLIEIYQENFCNHLGFELQKLATKTTVEYIYKNMIKTPSYQSKFEMYDAIWSSVAKQGLFMEFGVYQGTTINFFAKKLAANQKIYGFDSFEGLPECWRDGFGKGHFKVAQLPKVEPNVELLKGWFDQTLPTFLEQHSESASFIHIDCDLYSSTKTVLNLCSERIVPGTILIFDEYFNYPGWENGEFQAFQEFVTEHRIKYEYLAYVRTHEQVAIRIMDK